MEVLLNLKEKNDFLGNLSHLFCHFEKLALFYIESLSVSFIIYVTILPIQTIQKS